MARLTLSMSSKPANAATRSRWNQTVTCNANSNERRVRFQSTTRERNATTKPLARPWLSGFTPRPNTNMEVVEPISLDSLPDYIIEEAIAPLDKRNMNKTVRAVVLAGGETKNPLTRYRAMPAVPIGSALRLVDIPINNCLRAGVNKIYVLTQFQSHGLNSHITTSYPPMKFGGPDGAAWVDVLAAQQTVAAKEWYRGSADAIRKNIDTLKDEDRGIPPATDYIIMSGSAVYNLDLAKVMASHRARDADISIVTHLVGAAVAPSKGIVSVHHSSGRVLKFEEKPSRASLQSGGAGGGGADNQYLANMGIYVFKREALFALLASESEAITHLGHHVIPKALAQGMKVCGYQYHGYWQDISTLRSYFDANLKLTTEDSGFTQFEVEHGVAAAKGRMLPPALMQGEVSVKSSLIDDGAVLVNCEVSNSVVGQRMYIGSGSVVENAVLLGSPNWTNESGRAAAVARGERVYGIGSNCVLRNCIVDKNVTIGDNVQIVNAQGVQEADRADSDGYMIQEGLVVVMRGALIPDGTII